MTTFTYSLLCVLIVGCVCIAAYVASRPASSVRFWGNLVRTRASEAPEADLSIGSLHEQLARIRKLAPGKACLGYVTADGSEHIAIERTPEVWSIEILSSITQIQTAKRWLETVDARNIAIVEEGSFAQFEFSLAMNIESIISDLAPLVKADTPLDSYRVVIDDF